VLTDNIKITCFPYFVNTSSRLFSLCGGYDIYEEALDARDFLTIKLLDWFINEQGEEEANASELIAKLEMIGEDTKGLYMLDRELSTRVYAPPSLTIG
jgi:ferritin